MLKQIQFLTNPQDWDKSTMTAVGVERNGRIITPSFTSMTVEDIPAEYLSIWHKNVELFRQIGGGDWDASMVMTSKIEEFTDQEGGVSPQYISCIVHANFKDGTKDTFHFELKEADDLKFFDYFISESTWRIQEE